jgi:hypothetical protein
MSVYLIAPVKHYACDILGIEKNTYGMVASQFSLFGNLCGRNLIEYLNNNNLHDDLKRRIIEEDRLPSDDYIVGTGTLVDNRTINYTLGIYFKLEKHEPVGEEFLATWKIPLDLLCDRNIFPAPHVFKIKYVQIQPIPIGILERYKKSVADFIKDAERYDIQLLDEPIQYGWGTVCLKKLKKCLGCLDGLRRVR